MGEDRYFSDHAVVNFQDGGAMATAKTSVAKFDRGCSRNTKAEPKPLPLIDGIRTANEIMKLSQTQREDLIEGAVERMRGESVMTTIIV